MRRLHIIILLAALPIAMEAQNIQLHYDLGEGRKMLTSTVEHFKIDSIGNTFFFVDFDYGSQASGVSGVSNAYWELSREFKFWDLPLAIHTEINAGMFRSSYFASEINTALLLGASYTFSNNDFSKSLTLQTLYKYIQDINNTSFQITAVWALHYFKHKLTLSGFADFWLEDNYIFLSETQLWYNINKSFSFGSELEISNNFGGNTGLMMNPTVAIKWRL